MSGALEMGQFYRKLVLTLLPSVGTLYLRLPGGKGSALGEGVKSPLSEPEGNSLGTLYLCMQIRGPFQTFHLSGKPQTQNHRDHNVHTMSAPHSESSVTAPVG